MICNKYFRHLIRTFFEIIYIFYYLLCLIYAFINKFYEEYIFFMVIGFIFITISFSKYFIYRKFNIKVSKGILFVSIPIIFVVLLFNINDILKCLECINDYSILKLFSCITIMLSIPITYIIEIMINYYIKQVKKLEYKLSKLLISIIIYIGSILVFMFINNIKILTDNMLSNLLLYTVVNSILIIICYLPLRYVITRIAYKGIVLLSALGFMYLIYGLFCFIGTDINMIYWLLGTIMFMISFNFFYDIFIVKKNMK